MLLSTIYIAFVIAKHQIRRKQGYHHCGTFEGAKQSTYYRSSSLLFACDKDDTTNATSASISSPSFAAKSWTNIGSALKQRIAVRRRRGIPRTTITDIGNIRQHAFDSLSSLGRESCYVTTFLLLLYRVAVLTATTSSPHPTLRKFVMTNLSRWVVASLFMKLRTLHSQITALEQFKSNIDDDWFLEGRFQVINAQDGDGDILDDLPCEATTPDNNTVATVSPSNVLVRIRQVPSDGSCLFHAIGATLLHDEMIHRNHPPMSSVIDKSSKLRQRAVNALQQNPQRLLTVTEGEALTTAASLVDLAANQYDLTPDEYLTSMRDESVWGGGPEIIALASELQRQIVVLEPAQKKNVGSDVHFLKIRARFGEALLTEDRSAAIYILCANQQYPENYGRDTEDGNHFLAVFPSEFF